MECLGWTPKVYDVLLGGQCSSLKWFCDICESNMREPVVGVAQDVVIPDNCNKIDEVLNKLDQFLSRMDRMEQRLVNCEAKMDEVSNIHLSNIPALEQKMEQLISRVQSLEDGENSSTKSQACIPSTVKRTNTSLEDDEETEKIIERDIKELCDRDRRKANIIVFNIEESLDEDWQQRKLDDARKIQEVLSKINVATNIHNPVRMGPKKDGSRWPRPLKVTVDDERTKWKILKEAKNLRELGKENQPYIKKDMTVMEREQEAQLRKELQEKRQLEATDGGQTKWTIWKGRVTKMEAGRRNW